MQQRDRNGDLRERPAAEMISEDEPQAWLAKQHYTRSQARSWAVGELGVDFVDVRVRSCWIRGLTAEEREHAPDIGGMACGPDDEGAEAYWEVRHRNV